DQSCQFRLQCQLGRDASGAGMRDWRARSALLVISIISSLAIAELVARAWFAEHDVPLIDHVMPSEQDVESRQNTTRSFGDETATFDGDGFRIERPSADAAFTLLFIGDSF